jgi:hypothetical protein
MNKKGIAILGIIGIVVAVLAGIGGFTYYSLTNSPTVKAQLNYEAGQVLVNGAAVLDTIKLKQGDNIETGDDGEASVILYESVIVSLEPLTKITLADLTLEHPQIIQEGGTTFNQFTKLLGVEDYSIKAGNSVASVRATSFEFADGKVLTSEGTVEYEADGERFMVAAGKVVERIDGAMTERDMTPEERSRMVKHLRRMISNMQHLREMEADKHPTLKKRMMKQYDITEDELREKLDSIDRGEFDVDEIREQSPVKIESVDKIAEMSKVIQQINRDIDAISSE